MTASKTLDIASIIERQKIGRPLAILLAISWLVTFFDGFDTNVISFAAPYIGAAFNLSKIQLGNIFSAGLAGTLMGSIVLGYLGDRIGRRSIIVGATLAFGLATLSFAFASGYRSLLILRFVDGIPLGGLLPLIWALNIEYSPTRYRATIVTATMIGYSLGTASGGPIAVWLIPRSGWYSVFFLGGAAALICTVVLLLYLPESIKFLAGRPGDPSRITATLQRLIPNQRIPAGTVFFVGDEDDRTRSFNPGLLFEGRLRRITPLIWIAYIASSMAVFFIVNWTPLIFEALRFSRADAARAASVTSLMGVMGGLCLMRFTDKHGAIALTVMPVASIVVLMIAGVYNLPHAAFLMVNALIGFFLIGGHFGMHSICGLFYPSVWRATGTGWAASVAKIGSIAGPMIGGLILATDFPVRHIFLVLACCPAVFAICVCMLGYIHRPILGAETKEIPYRALAKASSE